MVSFPREANGWDVAIFLQEACRRQPDTGDFGGETVHCQQFIDALRQIEDQGDLDPMVQLFSDSATLWNPELANPLQGKNGAREFWRRYKSTFATVKSTFRETIETKDVATLEWESRGTIAGVNQPFSYRGVTVLEWEGDKICRLAAYFSPLALTVNPKATRASAR